MCFFFAGPPATGRRKNSSFLYLILRLTKNAAALLVVALDSRERPIAYLWVRGVAVTRKDGSTRLGDETIGEVGSCFTFSTSKAEDLRVACSSNLGTGLFEIDLPLDLSACAEFWASFDDATSSGGVCDLWDNKSRPSARFLVDSEATESNDGQWSCCSL